MGLSSLGRAEAHVLASLRAVQGALRALSGQAEAQQPPLAGGPGFEDGRMLLEEHTGQLLGHPPSRRGVRIMVTMPGEAASDSWLVRELLANGMDCMRINCAHDDAQSWSRMIDNLRRAQRELGKECRVLMDLAGSKLRTGPIGAGPAVVKWSPWRDPFGRVLAPARVWLTPREGGDPSPCPGPDSPCLPVPLDWLASLSVGDRVDFVDARGAERSLEIAGISGRSRWAECAHTAYVAPGTRLTARRVGVTEAEFDIDATAEVAELPPRHRPIVLRQGDVLVMTRDALAGSGPEYDASGRMLRPASISCTAPEIFDHVRLGHRVSIDDGKLAGIVRAVERDRMRIEVTHAAPKGVKLRPDRGINFPDTDFQLPALTNRDIADLDFVAARADLVGLSFVQCAADVYELQARLKHLGAEHLGIVLKIETADAFQHLPELLLAAMRSRAAGVMIARGDLAVECGWERLAEIQEEILCICEAAHVPVIWATQVLENLAKTGLPSRAEITDAAMAVRAECVMLNKGPHIVETMRVLSGILETMQGHQTKKTPRLRKLRSWRTYEELAAR